MNRLPSLAAAKKIKTAPVPQRIAGFNNQSLRDGTLAYKLIGPIHYEPNYAYPLIVWLHGSGDDERQIRNVLPHVSLRNYIAIAPRSAETQSGAHQEPWPQDRYSVDAAWHKVRECIEIAQVRYNVNADRVFIAGLQNGGTMALRLALSQPEQFAGAISIGGAFPVGQGALGRLNLARNLPLLIAKGLDSTEYTCEQMNEEIRLFHAACLQVHYRVYRCGDELMTDMLRDMDAWLMERVTGAPMRIDNDVSATPTGGN